MIPKLKDHATFSYVAQANRDRCSLWHALDSWTTAEWACAAAGEMGETCNVVKKLFRIEKGHRSTRDPNPEELRAQLQKEIGDTFIYLDLLAQSCGLSMYECVAKAFNEVSEREGYPQKLI